MSGRASDRTRNVRRADLAATGVVAFDAAGRQVIVADVDGEVRAYHVVGPAAADAGRAAVAEGRLRCPRHGWPVDPIEGRCGAADRCRFEALPVALAGDAVVVTLPPA